MHIRFNFTLFAEPVPPRDWILVDVPACTPRVALVHTDCGHHSRDSWEFNDEYDHFDWHGERRRVRRERRRMQRIARDYAAAHTCPTAAEIKADEEACAEAMAWLDALTTCPHCGGDGAPTGRAFVDEETSDEHAEPVELEYRCGACWSFYTRAREANR